MQKKYKLSIAALTVLALGVLTANLVLGTVPSLDIRREAEALDWDYVDTYLGRLGVGAVVKRLGFLIEAMELDVPNRDTRLEGWARSLTAGISKLDPSSPREVERIHTRWRLGVNLDERLFGARGS